MKYIISCAIFFLWLSTLIGQQSHRKLVKQAEVAMSVGKYDEAAKLYTKAWKQKQDKTEWRYLAGEAYLKANHYKLAAEALSDCTQMAKDFPMVNLYYARALKQNKRYSAAIPVYKAFLASYQEPKNKKLQTRVKNEIEGCQMALKLQSDVKAGLGFIAKRLDDRINTEGNEFGLAFFTDDILYFSSTTTASNASMLRSQRLSGDWLASVKPDFPDMPPGHFCNGSFSPDHKRFYFTICEEGKEWGGVESACDIYLTQNSGTEWSAPVKMRDYIKMDGTTATHPCVIHVDGVEFVYFSTNRIGGKGGMDIWYTYRFLDTDDFDYALPQNAGPTINTPGDEVTPFYDVRNKTLFFSSNGHPTIGGFDIFQAKGEMEDWTELEWLPLPFNSAANDYYYTETPNGNDSYLVSNRATEEKSSTTDEDIFYLSRQSLDPKVSGNIFAANEQKTLDQVEVSLFETRKSGERRLLQSQISMDGTYAFNLIPGKQFRIEVFRVGYQLGFYDFNAEDLSPDRKFEKDFFLSLTDNAVIASTNAAVIEKEEVTPVVSEPSNDTSPYVKKLPELPTAHRRYTPKHKGVYYKVQLSAVLQYDEQDTNLRRVAQFGRVDLEYILEKGWIRLLLADYFTLEEAQHVMKQCRMLGYPDAFIVKYKDGIRQQ